MTAFQLSATLSGHEDDVKCLIAPTDDFLVSGSRDSTIRVWYRSSLKSREFNASIINHKTSSFVNSLAYYDDGKEQLIVSGGSDNLINMTSLAATVDVNEPQYCFVGHAANICTLDALGDLILSGSWDSTAKAWNRTGDVVYNLRGHQGSVLGVKFFKGKDKIITCGADKTIKVWNKGQLVKSIVAHEDAVRDLVVLGNGDFASCSNDGIIKIWDGDSFELKQTLSGHQSFIYSLCVLPDGDLVSCGEDRSVRFWRNGRCIQAITLPCMSVWKVVAFPNGDIAVGSSDSLIRVFTKDSSRVAPEPELREFSESVKNSSVGENLYGTIDKERLPGEGALSYTGTTEGETKMILSAISTIEIYQWTNKKWIKIGQVERSASSDKKKSYQGGQYDYVFDVDVEDGKPSLKLPFNVTENPYEAADRFLADNDLPYSYLQQVVNFILQNAQGMNVEQTVQNTVQNTTQDVNGKRSRMDKPPSINGILPQSSYLSFSKFDVAMMTAGFRKLNSQQPQSCQLESNQVETLISCEDYEGLAQLASKIINTWQNGSELIGFDILRAIVTKIKPFESLFVLIRKGLSSDNLKVQMMALRVLVNVFSASQWGEVTFMETEVFDVIFTQHLTDLLKQESEGKNGKKRLLSITVATLLLNYTVLINKFHSQDLYAKSVEACDEYLPLLLSDEESSYRFVVGIGTLYCMEKKESLKELADSIFGVYAAAERFAKIKESII
ncbi:hypothetical protein FOA43_004543 [Brettanomyces nanus]|uniref:Phospholipase A-2-activating protein n=1 Tax=Eeniella nana TaxID=13502 RepID=A0A875SCE5_EENNA|nr:uncharacterized protein FOA43_004543 [Brettanomyces nanus]QPG77139.1 hypothetical protein FOA43_004543 [Brettanomyces nanus]